MTNKLTVTIFYNNVSEAVLSKDLQETFGVIPEITVLPSTQAINEVILSARGNSITYTLLISAPTFETCVFKLLSQLEDFGHDWKFRKPMKIISDKYTFIASIFPEFGEFNKNYIRGMVVILDEGVSFPSSA